MRTSGPRQQPANLWMTAAGFISLGLCCCSALGNHPARDDKEFEMGSAIQGMVRVDGAANPGAQVFLLDTAATVQATCVTGGDGRCSVTPPAGFSRGWLLFKLARPVVGIRAVPLEAGAPPVELNVAGSEVHRLDGQILLPPGIAPDWLEVHLTPRRPVGVPEALWPAILAVGTGRAIQGTYLSERITGATFQFRVLPGVYSLRVERSVEAPLGVRLPVPNLGTTGVTMSDHIEPTRMAGGFAFSVNQDLTLTVQLAVAEE